MLGTGRVRYRVIQEIGRGATGVVFEAVRTDGLPARLAVKVPRTQRSATRLAEEAAAAERIQHPRIARVIDACLDSSPPFLVLERAVAGDLRDELRARGGRLTVERSIELFRGIATAVAYAHGRGVVHGDIKPENVLIDRDGNPKVCDFGAALAREDRAHALANSLAGLDDDVIDRVRGTFGYLAPELWDGARPDPRSDVFALGVLLYEMLTGRRPVGSFAPAARTAPGIEAFMDSLLERALAADPEHRPADAAELLHDLEQARRRSQRPAPLDAPPAPCRAAEHRRAVRRLEEVRLEATIHALVAPALDGTAIAARDWRATSVGLVASALGGAALIGLLASSSSAQTLGALCAAAAAGLGLVLYRRIRARSSHDADAPLQRARRALPPPTPGRGIIALPETGELLLPMRLRRLMQAEQRLGLREQSDDDALAPVRPVSSARLAAARDPKRATFREGHPVGPWRLESVLGVGARAEVWRARPDRAAPDLPEGAPDAVALKLPVDENAVCALKRETSVARALDGAAGFRRVLGADLEAHPPWVALELIEGADLARYLDEHGALPADTATRLVMRMADALAHAHERGLVHGDLHPRNVIVDQRGAPIITDLGAARSLEHRRREISFSLSLSVSGPAGFSALGTLSCAAPEVLEGTKPDLRSDVYSLGAVAYAAFTGRRPVGCLAPLGDHVPHAVADVVRRCLDPDRTRRYPSAVEAARALKRALAFVDLRVTNALADLDPQARQAYYRAAMQALRARADGTPARGGQRVGVLRMLVHARRQCQRALEQLRRQDPARVPGATASACVAHPKHETPRSSVFANVIAGPLERRVARETERLAMLASKGRG